MSIQPPEMCSTHHDDVEKSINVCALTNKQK